jgi:hypothetical protein
MTPEAEKWNAIYDVAHGATPNELIAQFGEPFTAWRLGKHVNREDWAISGAPLAPDRGKDLGSREAHREYGRAIIVACGNNTITVKKPFKRRH